MVCGAGVEHFWTSSKRMIVFSKCMQASVHIIILYLLVSQNAWFAVISTDALARMEPQDTVESLKNRTAMSSNTAGLLISSRLISSVEVAA